MDSAAVTAAWRRIQVSAFKPASEPLRQEHSADEVALGQALFFDADLSRDGTLSCGACHSPSHGWTDGLPRARGKGVGSARKELHRNTISLLNVRLRQRLFWDGRAQRLKEAALIAAANPNEMDTPAELLAQKVARSAKYSTWFARVYPGRPVTPDLVGEALAAFVDTVPRAKPSAFDRFSTDPSALTPLQKKGLVLFTGKAHCLRCHNGPSLTDGMEHFVGLKANGSSDPDANRMMVTPPLRNLGATAPYMHNGSLATLEDVVDFYNRGGDTGAGQALTGQDPDIVPLDLSDGEKKALVAFLKSLGADDPSPSARPAVRPASRDAGKVSAAVSTADRYENASSFAPGYEPPVHDPESDEDAACVKSFTFEKFLSGYFKSAAARPEEGELLVLLASHQATVAYHSNDLSRCDALAPQNSAPGSRAVRICRRDALHMMRIRDLVSRSPRFADTCGMQLPELADYGKDGCAAILAHIGEPARLCSLLVQGGAITPKQSEACVFHFSAYTRFREPNFCETLDPPRAVREECHDVVGFARASASGQADDCGDSAFCRNMLRPDALQESLDGIRSLACLKPRR